MEERDYEILGDVEIEGELAEEINKKINEAEHDIAEAKIRSLINKRLKAIREKDINGALAFYSADVLSFDVVNPLRFDGIDSVRKRLEEWFSNFNGPIKLIEWFLIYVLKISHFLNMKKVHVNIFHFF